MKEEMPGFFYIFYYLEGPSKESFFIAKAISDSCCGHVTVLVNETCMGVM